MHRVWTDVGAGPLYVSIPFSSGHGCTAEALVQRELAALGLNPFFIRAWVHHVFAHTPQLYFHCLNPFFIRAWVHPDEPLARNKQG